MISQRYIMKINIRINEIPSYESNVILIITYNQNRIELVNIHIIVTRENNI